MAFPYSKGKWSIIEWWRQHFSSLLNRPPTDDPEALDLIPQKAITDDLDLPSTLDEVKRTMKQTSIGKASGIDGLPAEIFKAAGPGMLNTFHNILTIIWEEKIMPNDFHDAFILTLFKYNDNNLDCWNYHDISSLSIAGKNLAQVILNHLLSFVSDESLPESQYGFRPASVLLTWSSHWEKSTV